MKGMKLGWPIIIAASIVPIVLWGLAYPLEARFIGASWQTTFRLVTTSIGQMLGLAGMAMFALNLALAARVRWMEDLFGGMNKVYIAHHILGGLAFVLLLFHPLFLALKFLLSGGAGALQFFFFSSDPAVNYGIIALGLMILFLVLTFFVKLPYHIWKFTHKFLGAAFFFASLHVLLIASDVTMVKALKYYMFALVVIGFVAIIYRTILGALIVPRREYVVESVACVNDTITEVRLKPKEGTQMRFQPGQFIFIGFPDSPGLEEVHPFSISSSPDSETLTIGVKSLGDYTSCIKDLQPGARAVIEGPFGRTSYRYLESKDQIWIAGGIGITPFLGMARALKPGEGYHIDLYYSVVEEKEAAFLDELQTLAEKNPDLRVIPWFTKTMSYLTADAIIEKSGGVMGREIVLCGPPPMMKAMRGQLEKWKVPVRHIHSEEFSMN